MQLPVNSRFDHESTADEVLEGVDLKGRLAVITGGSTGVGRETARALAKAGADVFLGARREDALREAAYEIGAEGASVAHWQTLDLMNPDSVDAFADAVLTLDRPVDILVNNAGIMCHPLTRDARGIESHLGTNFIGHALLLSRLAHALARAGRARLVSLTSTAHQMAAVDLTDLNYERRPYDKWAAYGQSKTADALLAVHAAGALASKGVTALAVHPGLIETELERFITLEEMAEIGKRLEALNVAMPSRKSLGGGASTSVWAATAPELEGKGPLYLEDCHVAPLLDAPTFSHGVMRYALDPETARQLWHAASELLSRPLPL